MDPKTTLFVGYAIIGGIFILFNKQIAKINYKLVLFYTDKLNLKAVFLFKIDDTNRNSLFFLTRTFTIFFGIALLTASLSQIYG